MYDFTTLSPYDFEDLVRDLLQKEFNLRFSVFKAGKDKGVDLRYSTSEKNDEIVVQCKHYAGSPLTTLLSKLRNEESPKVNRLSPNRYIFATSLSLNESNKKEIINVFNPFIRGLADVFSNEDLNNLLRKFPEIERQNFKLWLSSTAVLDRIIHSEVFNRTRIDLEQIKKKIRLYVQGDALPEAIKILDTQKYCIISGIPGIGKTTLAEMLLLHYLANDYEAIKIQDSISDAYKLFNPEKKQVFYYDDFLGKTHLGDQLGKNEDEDLMRFLERLQNSSTHKFILTTREYILNQAISRYEKLAQANFDPRKYILNLDKYTRIDRAKILINHLYFSDVDENYLNAILEHKNYRQIINHKNFSPRIVERMTIYVKQHCTEASKYFEIFKATLDNPEQLWNHAFENQISDQGRAILLCLSSLPIDVALEDLEKSFNKFYAHLAAAFGLKRSPREFLQALKEVDGTFLTTSNSHWGRTVKFHNPSINDFLENYLRKNPDISLSLAESLCFFDQLEKIVGIIPEAKDRYGNDISIDNKNSNVEGLLELTGSARSRSFSRSTYGSFEKNLLFLVSNNSVLLKKVMASSLSPLLKRLNERIESRLADKAALIGCLNKLEKHPKVDKDSLNEILNSSVAYFKTELDLYEDFDHLANFRSSFPDYIEEDELFALAENLADTLNSQLDDLVSDFRDRTDFENFILDMKGLASEFNLDVSQEVDQVKEKADDIERELSNYDVDDEERYSSSRSAEPLSSASEDAEIDRLIDSIESSKKS